MKAPIRVATICAATALGLCFSGDHARGFSFFQYGGQNVVWAGAESLRYLSPGTFPEDSNPDILIRAVMGQWSSVPAATFQYSYARLAEDPTIDHTDGYSDTAAVPASMLDPGVLGVTYMVNIEAQWYDMDTLFSDYPEDVGWHFIPDPGCDVTINPTPDNGFSFYLVALHELGHAIGLGHDPIGDEPPGTPFLVQTMNPRYPSGGPIGQQNIVELHTQDRNGTRYLYPHSGPSEPPFVDLANASYTFSSTSVGKAVPVFFDPLTVEPADELTVRSVIENFGSTSEFYVRQGFYLSSDSVIDTGDMLIADARWDLAFQDAVDFDVIIDTPDDLPAGDYYVGSILDDLDEITEEYEDNNAVVYYETLTVDQLVPVVNDIEQDSATCGVPYAGPTPTVTHPLNMAPITWSIDDPEPGMTINPATGAVSWPDPASSEFLYTIFLRATNGAGSSTQILYLGVSGQSPEIVPLANEVASCSAPYVGPEPAVTSPGCMEPVINWSLDDGPPGMTIDHDTGIVQWDAPIASPDPYTITIRATNREGNGVETFLLDVLGSADLDGNAYVDLADLTLFENCMNGPDVIVNSACACADLDRDQDVDLSDFAAWTRAYTGQPEGACCQSDGSCSVGTAASCDASAGTFLGDGTACTAGACLGACCFAPPLLCLNLTEDNCFAAPGDFQGAGTTCASGICDAEPTGACCHADESCTEDAETECVDSNGAYQGDDTTCAGSDCSIAPLGACCDPTDWSCSESTQADCVAAGGTYEGDDTTCAATACPEYRNDIDPVATWYPPGAGDGMADDMTPSGSVRDLIYFDLAVYGGGGGAFDVTVSLYTDCPGNGGTLIPGTTATWNAVPDDDNVYTLSADLSAAPVTIPDTVWMVATFSTDDAGWLLAEAAEVGYTDDLYGEDDPPWGCTFAFGGTPPPYAGFWASLQCIDSGGARSSTGEITKSAVRTHIDAGLEALRRANSASP